jgi:hypothetical protein
MHKGRDSDRAIKAVLVVLLSSLDLAKLMFFDLKKIAL